MPLPSDLDPTGDLSEARQQRAVENATKYHGVAPQQAAKAVSLGMHPQTPPEAVARSDAAERMFRATYGRPMTAEAMADETNAAMMHDRAEHLSWIEKSMNNLGGFFTDPSVYTQTIPRALAGVPQKAAEGAASLVDAIGRASGGRSVGGFGSFAMPAGEIGLPEDAKTPRSAFAKSEMGYQASRRAMAPLIRYTEDPAHQPKTGTQRLAATGVNTVGGLAIGLTVGPEAAAATYGLSGFQQQQDTFRQKHPGQVPDARADTASLLTAGTEAGGELLGIGLVSERIASKFVPPSVKSKLARWAGETVGTAAGEAGEEAVQQLASNASTKYLIDPNQKLSEGVAESAAWGGFFGGSIGGTLHGIALAHEPPAPAPIEHIAQAVEAVRDSGLAERDPQRFAQVMQMMSPEGNFHLNADKVREYLQTATAEESAPLTTHTDVADQLLTAVGAGADVTIPVGTYMGHLAATPVHEALGPHLRTAPNQLSESEQADAKAVYDDFVQRFGGEWEKIATSSEGKAKAMKAVYDDALQQLVAGGRAPVEARQVARLIAANMNVVGETFGMDAHAAWKQAGLGGGLRIDPANVAASTAPGADETRLRQFVGPRAAGAPRTSLEEAAQMRQDGAHPRDIHAATGWYLAPDGRWRYEIADDEAFLNRPVAQAAADEAERGLAANSPGRKVGLNSLYLHPTLYQHYPQLAGLEVKFQQLPSTIKGWFEASGAQVGVGESIGRIILNNRLTTPQTLSTLHHEVQHAIQRIEGNASGTAPDEATLRTMGYGDVLDAEIPRIHDLFIKANGEKEGDGEYAVTYSPEDIERFARATAIRQTYERSLGETEAVNTQHRAELTDLERAMSYPEDTATMGKLAFDRSRAIVTIGNRSYPVVMASDVEHAANQPLVLPPARDPGETAARAIAAAQVIPPPAFDPHATDFSRRVQPSLVTRLMAELYKADNGVSTPALDVIAEPDEATMKMIADAFTEARHEPDRAATQRAYDALIGETLAQFRYMGDVKYEVWEGGGQAYPNSAAMVEDVTKNRHMWFDATENAFGEGADTSGNPMLRPTEFTDAGGRTLLANDVFRIVHDYFGHTQNALGFGPRGELNAYLEHATMFSHRALPALAAETLMQNAWVNFGPHMRRKDGTLPKPGETDYVPLAQRRFADQKAFAAPREVLDAAERLKDEARVRHILADYRSLTQSTPTGLVAEDGGRADGQGQSAQQPVGSADDYRPTVEPDGTIKLTHWSAAARVKRSDPEAWGNNWEILSDTEKERHGSAPARTYFGLDVGRPGGYAKETGLGPHRHTASIPAERLYDLRSDPAGLGAVVARAVDEGRLGADHATLIERAVKAAGYAGYWVNDAEIGPVAAVFESLPLKYAGKDAPARVLHQMAEPAAESGKNAPLGFFSAVERFVAQPKVANIAPAAQWIATLKNAPGVKAEELEWSGVLDWLTGSGADKITKAQVMAFMAQHGVAVREVMLGNSPDQSKLDDAVEEEVRRLVEEEMSGWSWENDYYAAYTIERDDKWAVIGNGIHSELFDTEEEADERAQDLNDEVESEARSSAEDNIYANIDRKREDIRASILEEGGYGSTEYENYRTKGGENYRELLLTLPRGENTALEKRGTRFDSSHWKEQNVVAHVRFDERTVDGKRTLFMQELQSDWHQKGRDEGYTTPLTQEDRERQAELMVQQERVRGAAEAYGNSATNELRHALMGSGLGEQVIDQYGREVGRPADASALRAMIQPESGGPGLYARAAAGHFLRWVRDGGGVTREHGATPVPDLTRALELQAKKDEALKEASAMSREMADLNDKANNSIPDAPFKATWPVLLMKRMIRYAADNNFDQIAWATGQMNVDLYSGLEEQTGPITVKPSVRSPGSYSVAMNYSAIRVVEQNGHGQQVGDYSAIQMTPEQINAVFGTDLGGRMIAGADGANSPDGQTFEGEDLALGGEGMRNFYDRVLPSRMKELGKKYGAQPTMARFATHDHLVTKAENDMRSWLALAGYPETLTGDEVRAENQRFLNAIHLYEEGSDGDYGEALVALAKERTGNQNPTGYNAHRWAKVVAGQLAKAEDAADMLEAANSKATSEVHAMPITPELRQAAHSGFALFQNEQEKGRILGETIVPSDAAQAIVIRLLNGANASTASHELGHFFLEQLNALANRPDAPAWLVEDRDAVLKWFGVGSWSEVQVEHHERFATTFNSYLQNGQAPSTYLRRVFQKFKAWLAALYPALGEARSRVAPEIADVFDRILATRDEIETVKNRDGLNPVFATAEDAAMTKAEYEAYTKALTNADETAKEKLLARLMKDVSRERTAAWKSERSDVRDEALKSVDGRPDVRATWLITRGKSLAPDLYGDGRVRFSRAAIVDIFGDRAQAILDSLPRGSIGEDGQHPDDVARMVGSRASGEALVKGVAALEALRKEAQPGSGSIRDQLADQMADREMKRRHGDMLTDGSIRDEATRLMHDEQRLKVMGIELDAMAKRFGGGNDRLTNEIMRRWAYDRIAARPAHATGKTGNMLDGFSPDAYLRAERKAANDVQRALQKKNMAKALELKRVQVLNFHLYKEARAAQEEIAKVDKALARYAKARSFPSMDQAYLEQIHGILERVGLREATESDLENRESLGAWIAAKEAQGESFTAGPLLRGDGWRKPYVELTVNELRAVNDSVENIAFLGRRAKKISIAARKQNLEDLVQEAKDGAESLKGPQDKLAMDADPRKRKSKLRLFDAGLVKLETIADRLDNGNANGVFNRVLVWGASRAFTRNAILNDRVNTSLRTAYDALSKAERKRWTQRVDAPELVNGVTPQNLNVANVLAIALNWGNESNRTKLLQGRQWDEAAVQGVLDRYMTKADWDFVQGVWDTLDSLWPDIAETERRMTGLTPERVQIAAVTTPHGVYKGGYYPVVYDPDLNPTADRNDAKEAESLFASFLPSVGTPKGHTMTRTGFTAPIVLNVEMGLFSHITKVIKRIAYAEFVTDAARFINHPQIKALVTEKLGKEYHQQMLPWLKRQVQYGVPNDRAAHFYTSFMRQSRLNATVVGMGLRVTTMLSQVAGQAATTAVIGPKYSLIGNARMAQLISAGGPSGAQAYVFARSEEMRVRADNVTRDVRDGLTALSGKTDLLSEVQRFAFGGIGWVDVNLVAIPAWLGGYHQALDQGMTEEEAVMTANKVVRKSQGSGASFDLSAVQDPDNEMMKLMTMFYSYFGVQYQRQSDIAYRAGNIRNAGDVGEILNKSFWFFLVIPILSALLTGHGPEDDDDSWGAYLTRTSAANLFAGVPYLRDIASFGIASLTGKGFASYSFTPVERGVTTVVGTARDLTVSIAKFSDDHFGTEWAGQAKPGKKAVQHAMESAGYIAGLPTGQPGAWSQYLWDVMDGEQQVDGPLQFFHDLAFGVPKERRPK